MIKVAIPGRREISLAGVVFDMNGTLTVDGRLGAHERQLIISLASQLDIWVLTADTFGTATAVFADLPVRLGKLSSRTGFLEKKKFLESRGSRTHAAVGNGYNDHLMLKQAVLGICVLGPEGAHPLSLAHADLVVPSTVDAIELFLSPQRLVAGLRR
ncbi:MAG: hypothetical protein JXO49_05060 [Deltaproteobacteria bacterium]|nr:hypothetical protein [Candidatus Anaeroferrophillus wilburensis]MBN2888697.1 hypothetical protein [Deltaproteobacteria bacterium]